MTDYMGQFIRTGDVQIATDFGIGVLAYVVAFSAVWFSISRSGRFLTVSAAGFAALLYVINRDFAIVWGMGIRGFFVGGAMPFIGWFSFLALLLLTGATIGIIFAHRCGATFSEPREALREKRHTVAEVRSEALPKQQPQPARLVRVATPPAVPVAYRRERVSITDGRR